MSNAFVAIFEIKAECSVVSDDLQLEIRHPQGLYRALIKNLPREDFSTPFVLSLSLYFDAPKLEEAEKIARERLTECLNMLAFTVGSSLSLHRIRQIVDCSPASGMHDVLFWGDEVDHEDPQPVLDKHYTETIDRLSEFQVSPAIKRAMRWYRLGINATVPDDQFQYFWFALEIIAESQKGQEKVPSNCPHCTSPLFCQSCNLHPVHKRYQKQAIQSLLFAVDNACDDLVFKRLDKTRNGLMHGRTLEEIEKDLSEGEKHIVDTLGKLVWRALAAQFPREVFDGNSAFGVPSTYLHRRISGIAHLKMGLQTDAAGNLDLSFSGTKVEMVSDRPPQSALPSILVMSDDQYKRLWKLSYETGGHQKMCQRIAGRVNDRKDGHVACIVIATDLSQIIKAVNGGEAGSWQDLFREILGGSIP